MLRPDFRPGYPIDSRSPKRIAGLANGPVGDFERSAARVVARLTGEPVILQDDGSQDGLVDIRIEHLDGGLGYVEVWTDIQREYAASWSGLRTVGGRLPRELLIAGGRDWFVTVSGFSRLRVLEVELEGLLARLEATGRHFEWVAEQEALKATRDPAVRRLVELGVVTLSSTPSAAPENGIVRLYPAGIDGPWSISWEPVHDWIERTLTSSRVADVRAKLARTSARDRHLFVGLTFTSPGEVFFALSLEERSVPSEPPSLPNEITHLWLMNASSPGRCLAWFPDRGWLDVMQHWATD